MKKTLSFVLLLALLLAAVPAQGKSQPFLAAPLTPDDVITQQGAKDDARSAATVSGLQRASVIVTFDESVDPSFLAARTHGQVIHRYKHIFNGASLVLAEDQIETLAAIPGITGIYLDEVLHIDTDASPEFIGATDVWADLGGQERAGENVIVGVLDTGIWPEHPSYSDPDPSGKAYGPTPGGGTYDCNFGNTAWNPNDAPFTCNNKLIGAYEFMDTYKAVVGLDANEFDSARDSDGHGSHTSSTAAGNAGVSASIMGSDLGIVSGIAPRAKIIMYRVCGGPTGSCYSSDSAAAVEQAIIDGVDVINFSIGGGSSPFSDVVSLAFLSAYENGVFVACSAGNSGPGADTVGHREPWVTTVAATTQSRDFQGQAHIMADNGDTLHLIGTSVTGGASGELVLGADYGDALCGSADGVNPFAPGTFTADQIVVCSRGVTARVEKSANVAAAGGGGVILYNPTVNTVNADNHFLPTVHIDNVAGAELLAFMAAHTGLTADITGGVKVFGQGDVMAAFSSRGGPGQSLGISKPDIAAPGVNILAANTPALAFPIEGGGGVPGEMFHAIGGTSMASPHIAGAAALLVDLHRNWSPGQIKSALMTTAAFEPVVKEDAVTPADPYDTGSGRVDLTVAGDPGLTISATAQDFLDLQDELWNANYPSIYLPVMPGRITLQRTVHNELGRYSIWLTSVEAPPDVKIAVPRVVRVRGHKDATFSIGIDARLVPLGETRHAAITLTFQGREVRIPITLVRQQPIVTLEKSCDPASISILGTTNCTITAQNTSYSPAAATILDRMPAGMTLMPASVTGATPLGISALKWTGTLAGASAPEVSVIDGTGTTPAGGYLPLSLFGIAPIAGVGDESIVNFSVNPYVYAGVTYDRIGLVSNGYAVVGGGDSGDINYVNQILPDTARPNNVLAPFWTDLDVSAGGAVRAGVLTDGVNSWLVLEWDAVSTWSGDDLANSFQIWIGTNGTEDISFAYGVVGDGDGGFLTVGAEDSTGLSGQSWYANGAGTLVAEGTELRVVSVPGAPGESHVITYTAIGKRVGTWLNCAELTADLFQGTNLACFAGETVPQ